MAESSESGIQVKANRDLDYRRCGRRGPSMNHAVTFRALILILILGDLESVTVVNHHPDEEYFLEHEVLYEEAINEAKKLQLYPGILNVLNILIPITKSVTRPKPLVRLHSNVWSIKHLYEALQQIYLSFPPKITSLWSV